MRAERDDSVNQNRESKVVRSGGTRNLREIFSDEFWREIFLPKHIAKPTLIVSGDLHRVRVHDRDQSVEADQNVVLVQVADAMSCSMHRRDRAREIACDSMQAPPIEPSRNDHSTVGREISMKNGHL